LRRAAVGAAALLGAVTAANTLAFSAATARAPLGTVVAVEFCGPLAVAALGARGRGARGLAWLVWPALALAGVAVITAPWRPDGAAPPSWTGLGLAALAAVGWGGYIVLTAHVGRRSEGLQGLAVAMTTGAALLAPLGLPQAWPALRAVASGAGGWSVPARVLLAALLVPLAAYALEMSALRRLDQGVFGVWMALEPAVGMAAGWLLLAQDPSPAQVPGVLFVVLAGIGAARGPAPHRTMDCVPGRRYRPARGPSRDLREHRRGVGRTDPRAVLDAVVRLRRARRARH